MSIVRLSAALVVSPGRPSRSIPYSRSIREITFDDSDTASLCCSSRARRPFCCVTTSLGHHAPIEPARALTVLLRHCVTRSPLAHNRRARGYRFAASLRHHSPIPGPPPPFCCVTRSQRLTGANLRSRVARTRRANKSEPTPRHQYNSQLLCNTYLQERYETSIRFTRCNIISRVHVSF
jgi:hypothetical protein